VAEHEVPVGHVPQRREHVCPQPRDLAGQEQDGVRKRNDEHQVERGQKPPRSPEPESLQVDRAAGSPLREQQGGDEVSAQHEEDLNPEEPPGYPRDPGVVEEHGDDSERTQPVETGHVG
jgi:hypothetical protein